VAPFAIDVQFQPWIEPASGAVAGAEALVRSQAGGSAADLFAEATASRSAERLSQQIQERALRMAAGWGGPIARLPISLNLLPAELARPDHDQKLLAMIDAAKIDPHRVIVEITESDVLVGDDRLRHRLDRLRAAGVRVALDDFGSGYASLSYLATLPLDIVKIDRSLVTNLVGGGRDRIVMRAMIRLVRDLGLKVLVEGVESTAQLVLLATWGCDLYQGFLSAGALNEDELARFVAAARVQAA
jgi:EAL domain-containing protein (putative c-di-GMP-specific phosphodiesterase class I)